MAGQKEQRTMDDLIRTTEEEWFQLYRAILKSSAIPIMATGNDLRTIREVSEGALQLLGCERDDLIGNDAGELYANPQSRKGLIERLGKESSVEEEVLLKTKKYGRKWIKLTLTVMRSDEGNALGTLGVFKDITRERVLEEEVRNKILADFESLYMFQEVKTEWLRGHADGVAEYTFLLANEIRYDSPELLERFARIHDIGKLKLPESMLDSKEIFETGKNPIEVHAVEGDEFLRLHLGTRGNVYDPRLRAVVRHHHEKWDGKGYPDGRAGEDIPIEARIVGIADAYKAMREDRPYRPARTAAEALAEIEKCAGSQFDPRLAKTFVRMMRNMPEKGVLEYF